MEEQINEEQKDDHRPMNQAPAAIALDEKGRVLAKNNGELLRYCNALVQSEMVPKQFNTPQKLFGALMFVRALGLPDVSIRQTAVVHGVPQIYGDLPLALAQSSGELSFLKEQLFDKDYNIICFENKNLHAEVYGAVCFMARNKSETQSFAYTLDDARKSDLYPAKSSSMPWSKYTKAMLRYKARALGIKSLFADKMNGVGIAEWDSETTATEELKDVSPAQELADELNKST